MSFDEVRWDWRQCEQRSVCGVSDFANAALEEDSQRWDEDGQDEDQDAERSDDDRHGNDRGEGGIRGGD